MRLLFWFRVISYANSVGTEIIREKVYNERKSIAGADLSGCEKFSKPI